MAIYRQKIKGKFTGKYIAQYPVYRNPVTGKVHYTCKTLPTRRQAERLFNKKMVEWEEKRYHELDTQKDYTLGQLVDWYLGLKKVQSKRSYDKDQERGNDLKKYFGKRVARTITALEIEDWQETMLKTESKRKTFYRPATINRIFSLMRRIFNLAVRERMLELNPCWKVKMLPENNSRKRVLTPEEFGRLCDAAPDHLKPILVMAYFTGMRIREILGLFWSGVHLQEGYIELRGCETKTDKPRQVYLADEVIEVLRGLSKVRSISGHVFLYKGRPILRITRSLATACKKAGIKDFTIHDMRHTFNTHMRKAGVHKHIIMAMTGHETEEMFTRYDTIDSEDQKLAIRLHKIYITSLTNEKRDYEKVHNPSILCNNLNAPDTT